MTPFSYSFEKLSDAISVCVTPEHKFGTDAFLLADFAQIRRKDIVCDLGTGCGIIPLILTKTSGPKQIYGVDIQPQAIAQLQIAIERSKLTHIIPICKDLKELTEIPAGSLDAVTCNPPYKAGNTGILSELPAEQIARHEVMCTIDDICQKAASLLKFGGKLCICQRPERLADVISAMRAAKIEPKRLRFVAKTEKDAPWLFLIEGKKGAKPFLQVLPTLPVYEGEEFSQEMRRIYAWDTSQNGESRSMVR
jgi:tRNA1(Val) A37 N6-methylase TrmN6